MQPRGDLRQAKVILYKYISLSDTPVRHICQTHLVREEARLVKKADIPPIDLRVQRRGEGHSIVALTDVALYERSRELLGDVSKP